LKKLILWANVFPVIKALPCTEPYISPNKD